MIFISLEKLADSAWSHRYSKRWKREHQDGSSLPTFESSCMFSMCTGKDNITQWSASLREPFDNRMLTPTRRFAPEAVEGFGDQCFEADSGALSFLRKKNALVCLSWFFITAYSDIPWRMEWVEYLLSNQEEGAQAEIRLNGETKRWASLIRDGTHCYLTSPSGQRRLLY